MTDHLYHVPTLGVVAVRERKGKPAAITFGRIPSGERFKVLATAVTAEQLAALDYIDLRTVERSRGINTAA